MVCSFFIYVVSLHSFKDGEIYNSIKLVGKKDSIFERLLVTMEVDLRSVEEEKRTLRFFLNNKRQDYYFTKVPSKVTFAVYYFIIIYFVILCYVI